MHRYITHTLLFCSSAMCINPIFANNEQVLHKYIDTHFSRRITISPQQISQLSWVIDHNKRSFDMDARVHDPKMHIEVVRALTRLYCMQLLRSGSQEDYEDFVASQVNQNITNSLTFASFKKLSKHLQNLSQADYGLLETATILSAVSLSKYAANLAQFMPQNPQLANDNLEFLATTLRNDADIYPLARSISNENSAAKKVLYILFPPQTNFRHMLYAEGGVGMFKYLRTMIKHQYISQQEIDLWYAHWIVNIAGFRGHVSQRGSLYLSESVFQSMTFLKSKIDHMLHSPNYDPLIPYLEYRADLLGLNNLPQQQKITLAHLGAMLRMYNVTDGNALRVAFYALSAQQQKQITDYFNQGLQDNDRPAVTYFPALYSNTLNLVNGDTSSALNIALPIYSNALSLYTKRIRNKELNAGIALNFNKLSASKNIRRIIDLGVNRTILNINTSGEVGL